MSRLVASCTVLPRAVLVLEQERSSPDVLSWCRLHLPLAAQYTSMPHLRRKTRLVRSVACILQSTRCSKPTAVDPATSISFPNTLRINSKSPLPTFTLVGVGVRTVSFLGIRVYSVGFYADLDNPKLDMSKESSVICAADSRFRNRSQNLPLQMKRSNTLSKTLRVSCALVRIVPVNCGPSC